MWGISDSETPTDKLYELETIHQTSKTTPCLQYKFDEIFNCNVYDRLN